MTTRRALIVLLAGVLAGQVGRAQTSELAILEQSGRVAGLELKAAISDYGTQVRRQSAGLYRSADGLIEVVTDPTGKISRIAASKSGMFTQRLVTIGQSSLEDVVERYGKPKRVYSRSERIAVEYDNLVFTASAAPTQNKAEVLKGWTVQEIALFNGPAEAFVYVYAKSGALSPYKPSIFVDDVRVARLQSGRFFKAELKFATATSICAESVLKAHHPCVTIMVNGGDGYVRVERSILHGYNLVNVSESDMMADLQPLTPIDTDMIASKDLVVVPQAGPASNPK